MPSHDRPMKFAAATIALAAVLYSGQSLADAGGKGAGTNTCAEFSRSYAASPDRAEALYFSWAEGYMTALNTASLRNGPTSQNLDISVEIMESRVRAYCDAHPLDYYSDAVFNLFKGLPQNRPIK